MFGVFGGTCHHLLWARWCVANSSLRLRRGFRGLLQPILSRLAARRRGLLRPKSSWTCVPAPPRSSLWIGPMSPASISRRGSTSGSLAARTLGLKEGSYRFSVICITKSPDPGNSLFPPALLMRQPLTSQTWWVLWSRAIPPSQWSRTL